MRESAASGSCRSPATAPTRNRPPKASANSTGSGAALTTTARRLSPRSWTRSIPTSRGRRCTRGSSSAPSNGTSDATRACSCAGATSRTRRSSSPRTRARSRCPRSSNAPTCWQAGARRRGGSASSSQASRLLSSSPCLSASSRSSSATWRTSARRSRARKRLPRRPSRRSTRLPPTPSKRRSTRWRPTGLPRPGSPCGGRSSPTRSRTPSAPTRSRTPAHASTPSPSATTGNSSSGSRRTTCCTSGGARRAARPPPREPRCSPCRARVLVTARGRVARASSFRREPSSTRCAFPAAGG